MDDEWQVFFAAQIGASAALLGLLFVGVSLNLDKILAAPSLTRRGLLALMLLLAVLATGSLVLVPGQPRLLLAAELAAIGAGLVWLGASASRASWRASGTRPMNIAIGFALGQAAALPYLAAGAALATGAGGPLHWIAAAMILSTIKAVSDAWVLLVEINR